VAEWLRISVFQWLCLVGGAFIGMSRSAKRPVNMQLYGKQASKCLYRDRDC